MTGPNGRLSRCLLWAALPMAQTSQVEGRLAAILDKNRRQTMLTRKTVTVAVLAATIITAPLAALRPVAQAKGEAHSPNTSASAITGAATGSPLGDYNLAVARANLDIGQQYAVYENAVDTKNAAAVAGIIVPDYQLNSRWLTQARAVRLLQGRFDEYRTIRILLYYNGEQINIAGRKATLLTAEVWKTDRGIVRFSRHDDWVRTARGWRLAASYVK